MPLLLCFRPFFRRAAKRCCCRFTAANAVLQRASRACNNLCGGLQACCFSCKIKDLASRHTSIENFLSISPYWGLAPITWCFPTRIIQEGTADGTDWLKLHKRRGRGRKARADARALSPGEDVYWWNSWKSAGISYVATLPESVNMTG